ncbi:hypothetical protein CDAR_615621 [Caerostris darwini]|uniref:Uncharacterized protein n=1 Tax=Caerostris darwini TaxID=1538125 RepID=A0AAV4RUT3_9ARAC|nr:hypothetical protein CDAR_615621 [Caerostris darwini]
MARSALGGFPSNDERLSPCLLMHSIAPLKEQEKRRQEIIAMLRTVFFITRLGAATFQQCHLSMMDNLAIQYAGALGALSAFLFPP